MMKASWLLRGLFVAAVMMSVFPVSGYEKAQAQVGHTPGGEVRALQDTAQPLPDAPPIRLRIGSFVPAQGESLPSPAELRYVPDQAGDYYIVQFAGPIQESWKESVRGLGGNVLDYVPDFAFVVYMDAATLQKVSALPEVIWVGPYEPVYKVSSDLARATGRVDLNVQVFSNQSLEALAACRRIG